MEQGTLAEILGVEREIRSHLDTERERATRWLEDARLDLDREHATQLERLRLDLERRREAMLQAAHEQASGIVREAEAAARVHTSCDDQVLDALVRHHLDAILPVGAR